MPGSPTPSASQTGTSLIPKFVKKTGELLDSSSRISHSVSSTSCGSQTWTTTFSGQQASTLAFASVSSTYTGSRPSQNVLCGLRPESVNRRTAVGPLADVGQGELEVVLIVRIDVVRDKHVADVERVEAEIVAGCCSGAARTRRSTRSSRWRRTSRASLRSASRSRRRRGGRPLRAGSGRSRCRRRSAGDSRRRADRRRPSRVRCRRR